MQRGFPRGCLARALVLTCPHLLVAVPVAVVPDIRIDHVIDLGGNRNNRIAVDPADGSLLVLRTNGDIHRVDLSSGNETKILTKIDHGVSRPAGLEVLPDSTIIITGNLPINGNTETISTVTRGVPDAMTPGNYNWSVLAQTVPFPGGGRLFSHWMNAVAYEETTNSLYVNIGARTDHGEIQSDNGAFPTTRETGLTTILLKLPADTTDLVLPNDREQLRSAGYLHSEGLRNTYDIAFSSDGRLFGVENGPDRDAPEELNWLRPGHHYGFPWRLGTEDNPQQFPDYDPDEDKLLNDSYTAVKGGYSINDPTFPPPPADVVFTDPIANSGPDADHFRDPATGAVVDASDTGSTLATFTAHRCPLGLAFDTADALGGNYRGDAFTVCWTPTQPEGTDGEGPFDPVSQDLLHLELTPQGDTYGLRTTRIASGFEKPVDTVIVGDKLYVLEYAGNGGIWAISFIPASPPAITDLEFTPEGYLRFTLHGEPDTDYLLERTPDLRIWSPLLDYNGSETPLIFTDPVDPEIPEFFYRLSRSPLPTTSP